VRTAAPPRLESLAIAALVAVGLESAAHLRLRPGDERRQPVDVTAIGRRWLRLRLVLRLRAMVAVMIVAGLVLFARLVGLTLALMLARDERLRLRLDEARLLAEMRKPLALVVAVFGRHLVLGTGLRLVLPKLLLSGCDQTEIVLGVLVIVFGRDRVARTPRIARELNVFFGNMRGGAANLDIGTIGLENPGHRVLATPVVIVIIIVIPVAHPFVVLTVSHVLPLLPSLEVNSSGLSCYARRSPHLRVSRNVIQFRIDVPTVAFKDALPPLPAHAPAGPNHSACQTIPECLA